jgi:hypothetical protein
MPPPYATCTYRGYELVQWHEGSAWEVWHQGEWIDTVHSEFPPEQTVDSYLVAT